MKIKDIRESSSNIELKAKVVMKSKEQIVNTKYGIAKAANCIIEDDTGKINLVLWNKQIDKIKEGNLIYIKRGILKKYNGNLYLSVPKNGVLKVLSD